MTNPEESITQPSYEEVQSSVTTDFTDWKVKQECKAFDSELKQLIPGWNKDLDPVSEKQLAGKAGLDQLSGRIISNAFRDRIGYMLRQGIFHGYIGTAFLEGEDLDRATENSN